MPGSRITITSETQLHFFQVCFTCFKFPASDYPPKCQEVTDIC